jgi:ABC-type thiamine transport system ATPase subunit
VIVIERFIRRLERCAADERIDRILTANRRVHWQGTPEILCDSLSDQRRQRHAAARCAQHEVPIGLRGKSDVGGDIP